MAILKHLASKSANYGNVVRYLMFEHDKLSGKPLLEDGLLVMRQNFLIDGLECDPATFDIECTELNDAFHKNSSYDEIKSHHYILSFDPKDVTESGLTVEKAQSIGMDYAKKNFSGHQALVCTHPDGDNHSGNIHVHIVINSLRKDDVERQDYMERNCDSRAGYKHHVTKPYLRYLKQDLMDTCIGLGLHQVDLLSPAQERITDKEQWAKARGQDNLDEENGNIIKNGGKPKKTKFQTQKDELRDAIRRAAETAKSEKEFAGILKEKYGITLKASRGRYSYLHPDRTRPVTGRMLGEDYREDHLKDIFAANAIRLRKNEKETQTFKNVQTRKEVQAVKNAQMGKPAVAQTKRPSLIGKLHISQQIVKERGSMPPSRRTRIAALQKDAQSVAYLQENGYKTLDDLRAACDQTKQRAAISKKKVDTINSVINRLNEQLHYTGKYYTHKKMYQKFLHTANKGRFRNEYRVAISEYESARDWLQFHAKAGTLPSYEFLDTTRGKFPGTAKVKEARDDQMEKRKECRAEYNAARQQERELRAIMDSMNALLNTPALDEQAMASRKTGQSL